MGETNSSGSIPTAGGKKEFASSTRMKRAELRQHPRFRVEDAKTQMYLKGFLTKMGIGRKNEARVAINLSEGGILVSTQGKLALGTRVQLRIEMEKFKDVIETEGEVRWCFASARNASDYYAGIQFLKLAPAHVAKIGQMRAWFTSPEFKQRSATRRRLADPEVLR
ncbi:MAG TPA: PilZ domain-containing protein [Planctomycetota bacterium]|nr:PilZ domain-containing protein [Planctomycetota bacterium]